jgi:SOS-response transcriptional repressor LexA
MPNRRLCLAPCEGEHFIFTLRTDALSCVNIPKGSHLLACPTSEPAEGDLVIADTPKGKRVRFFKRIASGVCLDARDPEIPPMILSRAQVIVLGVVCKLVA